MIRLLLRKLGESIPILLLVSLGAAALTDLIPESPGRMLLGEFATQERVAEVDAKLGVNDPFFERYWRWLSGAFRGDLGDSWVANEPVSSVVRESLWPTLEIAIITLTLSVLVSVGAAMLAARRAGTMVDRSVSGVLGAFQAVPSFVGALFVTQLLSVKFGLVPSLGWSPIGDGLGDHLETLLMPVVVLTAVTSPILYRVLRSDMVDVMQQDYVLSARARGLSEGYILRRHVLRPASRSLLTMTGLMFGFLIGGSIIIETFYTVPGLGSLVSRSIANQDVIVVQGIVLFVAVAYLLINLGVDIMQTILDPRLRSET